MTRFINDLKGHLQEVLWALFLVCLLLACLAMVFGRAVGYEITLWVCLGFAVLVSAIFAAVLFGNLLILALVAILRRSRGRPK